MNFNHPSKGGSTIVTRTVCAIVFMIFSFCWLYFFQADLLAVAQHVLSHGQTTYNPLVGAIVITLVLYLLQLGVYAFTRLSKRFHALTYVPSFLLLALLSHVEPDAHQHLSFGIWVWLTPLLFLLWIGAIAIARTIQPYEDDRTGWLLSRRVWVNLLILSVMMLVVTLAANSNAVFHFRAHAETALLHNDVDEALRVGKSSQETDASLTMLRAYALSLKGQLGDRLFHYPVAGNSDDLLLVGTNSSTLNSNLTTLIHRHLGALPRQGMNGRHYLRNLQIGKQATAAVADYQLCADLIDRDLDAFAADITKYYQFSDSTAELPRHYREALVLYNRQRAHPSLVYHDAVVEEDYEDLLQLEAQYQEPSARMNQVREKYQNSYWYYYKYTK